MEITPWIFHGKNAGRQDIINRRKVGVPPQNERGANTLGCSKGKMLRKDSWRPLHLNFDAMVAPQILKVATDVCQQVPTVSCTPFET